MVPLTDAFVSPRQPAQGLAEPRRGVSRALLSCQHELKAAKPFGARARRTYRLLRIEQACDLPMPVGSLTNLRIERIPM